MIDDDAIPPLSSPEEDATPGPDSAPDEATEQNPNPSVIATRINLLGKLVIPPSA